MAQVIVKEAQAAPGIMGHCMSSARYPLGSKQVVVKGPESLPSVVAAVGSSHEVLQHQSYVYEADVVIRRKVAL
jgi:hypothetical protein